MSPGKRARAEFRDREVGEADQLVAELTALSRSARQRDRTVPPAPGDAVPQAGTRTPRAPRAALLARGPLDRARRQRRPAKLGCGYARAVKRMGKWSMERMPVV